MTLLLFTVYRDKRVLLLSFNSSSTETFFLQKSFLVVITLVRLLSHTLQQLHLLARNIRIDDERVNSEAGDKKLLRVTTKRKPFRNVHSIVKTAGYSVATLV